jgi:hypothetical protein
MRGRIWGEFAKNTYHSDNVRGKRSRHHAHGFVRLWKARETGLRCGRPVTGGQRRNGMARQAKKWLLAHLATQEHATTWSCWGSQRSGLVPESVSAPYCRRIARWPMNTPNSNMTGGSRSKPIARRENAARCAGQHQGFSDRRGVGPEHQHAEHMVRGSDRRWSGHGAAG